MLKLVFALALLVTMVQISQAGYGMPMMPMMRRPCMYGRCMYGGYGGFGGYGGYGGYGYGRMGMGMGMGGYGMGMGMMGMGGMAGLGLLAMSDDLFDYGRRLASGAPKIVG